MEEDQETSNDITNYYGDLTVWYRGVRQKGKECMNLKQLFGAMSATVFKICITAVIVLAVFYLSVTAYDFGYAVFADEPLSTGEVQAVSVVITEDKDTMEVAELLESKGIIADAKVFYVQEMLSDTTGGIQPGVYELRANMTSAEILAMITTEMEEE